MRIEWVNHAAYVLDAGGVRLLADPWLEGTAFDHGWALLSPTRFTYDDFARITHLWFSHEHPDHFSPMVLKRIPAEHRARITVLYQATRDRKVVDFCRTLGFADVQELPPGAWTRIGELELLCQPHVFGDSWLCVRAGGSVLLNLNDCVVNTQAEAQQIRARIGAAPDVLLTQFSYANWAGNRDETARRRRSAAEKLRRITLQAEALQPRAIVPFASFVWFCHDENYFQNDGMNTVADAARHIEAHTTAQPIVLYPGDVWEVGAAHDNTEALGHYAADLERTFRDPRVVHAESVPFETLEGLAQTFVQRLRAENPRLLLSGLRAVGQLPPARILLTDLGQSVRLDLDGLTHIEGTSGVHDLAVSSSALAYCLKFGWGGDTLLVNGRFEQPPGGEAQRFRRYFSIASLNNKGESMAGYVPIAGKRLRQWVERLPKAAKRSSQWRHHAAGALMPVFLKGTFAQVLGRKATEATQRVVYAAKFSRWLEANPLEPNFQERYALYQHLFDAQGLEQPLDYLEFGVATGRSLRWWVEHVQSRAARFHGFDTFTGLPEDWGFIPRGTFSTQGIVPDIQDDRVEYHVGLFQETLPGFLEAHALDRRLIVHLDADLYSATLFVLTSLADRLKPGDVLIFDEFARMTDATHEFRAFDDFLAAYGLSYRVLGAAGGYIQVALEVL
jgi:hypothetical protein